MSHKHQKLEELLYFDARKTFLNTIFSKYQKISSEGCFNRTMPGNKLHVHLHNSAIPKGGSGKNKA